MAAPTLKTGLKEQDLALFGFVLDVTHISGTPGYAEDYVEGWRGAFWEFSNGTIIEWNIDTGAVVTTEYTQVPQDELQQLTLNLQKAGYTA